MVTQGAFQQPREDKDSDVDSDMETISLLQLVIKIHFP